MLNRNRSNIIAVFIMAFLAMVVMVDVCAASLQLPQQTIATVSDTLQKKLQDKSFTQDFARVTQFVNSVIEPHTDFDRIAPLVLGKHWKTATEPDRERFKHEFQTLIVRAYARAFVEYNDWKIDYLPLDIPKDTTKVVVKTRVLQPRLQPVEVDYRMFLNNGEWKVYDILIDGVSLITTYRSSFNDEIQKKGSLAAVIDNLAQRNSEALKSK
ncbi:MAG: ABC transporter substrate-binding protein [Methylococcaceae bacterium]|nr:ABC transporter substrate-binding protein [Methylococcaceae bacterium]